MSQLIDTLKYLFDFLKIYKASSSVNVLKWKEADMENSFKWAGLIKLLINIEFLKQNKKDF